MNFNVEGEGMAAQSIKKKSTYNRIANFKGKTAKKGEIRNPKGRPRKADCLLDCIKESLAKLSLNGVTTREQNIGEALVQKAETGDLKAIEILMSYLHAKPNQGIDLKAKGELFVRWDGNRNTPGSTPETPASTPS